MKRRSRTSLVVAILMMALIPALQAHCLWMGTAPASAAVSSQAPADPAHACCAPQAAPAAPVSDAPATDPGCPCMQIPAAAVAKPYFVVPPSQGLVEIFAVVETALPVESAEVAAPLPAAWHAPPPALLAVRAHGLRAPPELL